MVGDVGDGCVDPGEDTRVTNEVLIETIEAPKIYEVIMQKCLNESIFPDIWKL